MCKGSHRHWKTRPWSSLPLPSRIPWGTSSLGWVAYRCACCFSWLSSEWQAWGLGSTVFLPVSLGSSERLESLGSDHPEGLCIYWKLAIHCSVAGPGGHCAEWNNGNIERTNVDRHVRMPNNDPISRGYASDHWSREARKRTGREYGYQGQGV